MAWRTFHDINFVNINYKPFDASKGQVPPLAAFGSGYKFHVTGLNKAADGFPTTKAEYVDAEERRQVDKVKDNVDDIVKFEGCYHGHSDALLVRAARGADAMDFLNGQLTQEFASLPFGSARLAGYGKITFTTQAGKK